MCVEIAADVDISEETNGTPENALLLLGSKADPLERRHVSLIFQEFLVCTNSVLTRESFLLPREVDRVLLPPRAPGYRN